MASRRLPAASLVLAVLLASGCANTSAMRADTDVRIDANAMPASPVSRREAYEYHVLAGEMAIQRDNRVLAAREYVAALDYSNDPALARRATRIALFAEQPALAYRAAGTWARTAPDSLDAQRTAARMAVANEDAEGLAIYAPALVAAAASPDIGYRLLADVVSGAPNATDMVLDTLTDMARADRDSAPAQYALGVVALRYGRSEIAARAAERALALDPNWNDAVLLQAGVWIRAGETEKARQLVDRLPGNAASRAQYHLALARLLIEADQEDAALGEFEQAIELQPDNTDARYGLAILSLSLGQLARAETAFERLYKNGERADDAAFYLGTIAEQREDYGQAQRWYQRAENGGHAFEAQVRAARMIFMQDDLPGAQRRLAELRTTYPDLVEQLYAAEGQLLYEADEPRAALDIYNHGLEEVPDSSELRYGRSMAYERLGDIEAAKADLQAVLDAEPDDARALNALGYLIANHGTDYQRAADYIQRALEAEPDNPAILDSMGWVAYRLGDLDAARHYLERAYREFPDAEVAAHLGEVLWQQGQYEAARRIWQKAMTDNAEHPVLTETIKRLDP
ncbi:TPR repeat-containing protein [Salinisphaera sp. S4-8]